MEKKKLPEKLEIISNTLAREPIIFIAERINQLIDYLSPEEGETEWQARERVGEKPFEKCKACENNSPIGHTCDTEPEEEDWEKKLQTLWERNHNLDDFIPFISSLLSKTREEAYQEGVGAYLNGWNTDVVCNDKGVCYIKQAAIKGLLLTEREQEKERIKKIVEELKDTSVSLFGMMLSNDRLKEKQNYNQALSDLLTEMDK